MAIQGASPEKGRITPHLIVQDAEAAIDFYKRAFGAKLLYASPLPGERVLHAHIRVEQTMMMITDERMGESQHDEEQSEPNPARSPRALGGTSVLLELVVDDADAAFDRAVREGATPTLPVSDAFWGDRYGWVTDPFGHIWALTAIREILTPEQVEQRMLAAFGQMQSRNGDNA